MREERKLFCRIEDILFYIPRKTLQKRNFRQNSFDLGHLELLEVSRELQDWIQVASNLHVQWQYLDHEPWGSKEVCWVAGNTMAQIKLFKNTSKQLVIP